jgi:hypothetical protein
MPSYFRELFLRSAEVSEEGEIPLRGCLIDLSEKWSELGFKAQCSVSFTEDELKRHEQQLQEWNNYHNVQRLARKILGTDFEGWIPPIMDFAAKQQENEELLQEFMRRSQEYNKLPEEIREIWPYRERKGA